MTRIILTYGLLSGAAIILAAIGTITFVGDHGSAWMGYLTMLVGLSAILIGVRQHRDQALGGVIRFWPALGLGLGIAAAAGVAYVAIWEIYLATTHYTFMDAFVTATLAGKRAAGVSAAEYAKTVTDMEALRRNYANPLFRIPMTFIEIFPVGVLIALASAALLRNPRFLPAQARTVAA